MGLVIGLFSRVDAKLLVFEQHTQNPPNSFYLPGDCKVSGTIERNTRTVGTEAVLNLKGRLSKFRFGNRSKQNQVKVNRVFIMRIDTSCQDEEKQSVIDWVLRSQRADFKAAIITIMNAADRDSLVHFVLQCLDAIKREIPGTPIAIMVRANILTTCFDDDLDNAKVQLARQIVANSQVGVPDANSIGMGTFDSEVDDQLASAYQILCNRSNQPFGDRLESSIYDLSQLSI